MSRRGFPKHPNVTRRHAVGTSALEEGLRRYRSHSSSARSDLGRYRSNFSSAPSDLGRFLNDFSSAPNDLGSAPRDFSSARRPGAEIFTVIYRRLNNAGAYTEFASTGEKMFVDSTIPPGTQSVTYMLRTRRGDQVSIPSDAVTQHLGVPGNEGQQQGLTLAA